MTELWPTDWMKQGGRCSLATWPTQPDQNLKEVTIPTHRSSPRCIRVSLTPALVGLMLAVRTTLVPLMLTLAIRLSPEPGPSPAANTQATAAMAATVATPRGMLRGAVWQSAQDPPVLIDIARFQRRQLHTHLRLPVQQARVLCQPQHGGVNTAKHPSRQPGGDFKRPFHEHPVLRQVLKHARRM